MKLSNSTKTNANEASGVLINHSDLLSISCGNCGLINADDWCGATGDTIAVLNQRKSIRSYPRGTVLFHQGDNITSLYRLLAGIVLFRQVDSNGTMITPYMVSVGETIGFRGFIDGGVHGVSAVCATDAVLCRIPADVAAQAFSGSHPLERAFARHVAAELRQTEESVISMTTRSVRERLLMVFARLFQQFGCRGQSGRCRMALPLLRSDIASLAGIARETFSRTMHALEQEQLIVLEGDVAVFPDMARFRRTVAVIQPDAWAA